MKRMKFWMTALLCCAVCGVCLGGCKGSDTKQESGQTGKGLSAEEKKAKRGEE